ncbi:MAG: class I SAM-dependent methyltransferase [Pseudomonadota bacterium]
MTETDRALTRQSLRDLYLLLFGEEVDPSHIDYFESQAEGGRNMESLLAELIASPSAQKRVRLLRDGRMPDRKLRKLLTDLNNALFGDKLAKSDLDHRIDLARSEYGLRNHLAAMLKDKRVRARIASMRELSVDPGHFYSPVVDTRSLDESVLRSPHDPSVKGIKVDAEAMQDFWRRLLPHMRDADLPRQKTKGRRYYIENPAYREGDAYVYQAILRETQPKRIIEIGSGFSSALLLDTVDTHFPDRPHMTFIDPYPKLLKSMMRRADRNSATIIGQPVQDVDLDIFRTLEAGDILFIDSTHVLKTHSDVYWELAEILPILKRGVLIHFHDMFWPFEYPREWIFQDRRSWNELYAIQFFLMYQDVFEIVFFNQYFAYQHTTQVREEFGAFLDNPGGGLWLRKTGGGNPA